MTDHEARRDAFETEALRWLPDVERFALSLTREQSAADDLVQETYLRAWRHWETFRTGSEARAWLFTIARNVWHRSGARNARLVAVDDEVLQSLVDEDYPISASADESAALAQMDLAPAIAAAIHELPEPFREVVALVDLQDIPYAQAAAILGVPIGTVRSRLFRARRMLQQALLVYAHDAGLVPSTTETA